MFIYSYDPEETEQLYKDGFKLLRKLDKYAIFVKPKKATFNKQKYKHIKISNKLVF